MAPVRAKVDEEKVKKEMVQLEKVVVIAYFVGRQQSVKTLLEWLGDLSKETHEELVLGNNLGQGFFQITCKGEAAAQKVLMRTPHHSRWGTSIL
jgi:cell division inhibitor SulA